MLKVSYGSDSGRITRGDNRKSDVLKALGRRRESASRDICSVPELSMTAVYISEYSTDHFHMSIKNLL